MSLGTINTAKINVQIGSGLYRVAYGSNLDDVKKAMNVTPDRKGSFAALSYRNIDGKFPTVYACFARSSLGPGAQQAFYAELMRKIVTKHIPSELLSDPQNELHEIAL